MYCVPYTLYQKTKLMYIGKRVKDIRESLRMSLTELSEKSGVQLATLSRIEHLKMPGTIQSHINIANALGINLTELYQDIADLRDPKDPKTDTTDPESFTYNDKASYEILTSNILKKRMMPIILRVEPRGATNKEQNKLGSEKFIFVLEGEVNVHLGPNVHPVRQYQTLYFDAAVKHYFENTGPGPAKLISVVTPVQL